MRATKLVVPASSERSDIASKIGPPALSRPGDLGRFGDSQDFLTVGDAVDPLPSPARRFGLQSLGASGGPSFFLPAEQGHRFQPGFTVDSPLLENIGGLRSSASAPLDSSNRDLPERDQKKPVADGGAIRHRFETRSVVSSVGRIRAAV